MSGRKRILAWLFALVLMSSLIGGAQEGPATPTAATSRIDEWEAYFSEWTGTLEFEIGGRRGQVTVEGMWAFLFQPQGERAAMSLDELVVDVPALPLATAADVASENEGFFVTTEHVVEFSGQVDLATGGCSLRGTIALAGLAPGLPYDGVTFVGSGNFNTGEFEFSGSILAGGSKKEDNYVLKMKRLAKQWRRYSLPELLKQEDPTITCCGCENFIITTGGKKVSKVTSSAKKVIYASAAKRWMTNEDATIWGRCRCCDAAKDGTATLTITWTDSDGKKRTDKLKVVCKKPKVVTFNQLLAQPDAMSVACKPGECVLITFDPQDVVVKEAEVTKGKTCARVETKPKCCKTKNSVVVYCTCTADKPGDATIVVKYYLKRIKTTSEATITVKCK
jgi:hypothetical protein